MATAAIAMMKDPPPVHVTHLFPDLLAALLELLEQLAEDEWAEPTVCAGWSVKDVAAHLLGGDVGVLSRGRDGYTPDGQQIEGWEELVALINRLNAEWVTASRRLSPRLLTHLLQITGEQVVTYFRTLDPDAIGGPVSWAGPEPAPVWLDLAREYTERWLHQQHIREAVDRPGLTSPRYLGPVLFTFVHALPRSFQDVPAATGTAVVLFIDGPAGGTWTVRREAAGWKLYVGREDRPATSEVDLPSAIAWRLFTRGIMPEVAQGQIQIRGEEALGERLLGTVAIIA